MGDGDVSLYIAFCLIQYTGLIEIGYWILSTWGTRIGRQIDDDVDDDFDVFVDVLLMCFAGVLHKLSTSPPKRKMCHIKYVFIKSVGNIIYTIDDHIDMICVYYIYIHVNTLHIHRSYTIPTTSRAPFPAHLLPPFPGDGPGSGPVPLREDAPRLAAGATAGGGGGDHQQLDAAGAAAGGDPEDFGG